MQQSVPTYACLDIGTNSVLLLLASKDAQGVITESAECFRTTRLGEGVDQSGELSQAAVSRTLQAVAEFVAYARNEESFRPLHWAVVTTSAARDAANGSTFLEPCSLLVGCPPRILAGTEEAETVYAGAVSDFPEGSLALTIDIGGGSTELAFGRGRDCQFRTSLNMGCVRFGERFGLYDHPSSRAIQLARAEVRKMLKKPHLHIKQANHTLSEAQVIASGGTATSFAALAQSVAVYDKDCVHGYTAPGAELEDMTAKLLQMPLCEREKLVGIKEGRAKVLPAGLLILSECLAVFEAHKFRVTTRGLRFGLARNMADGILPPMMIWE